jgi:hypothetical protein
MKVNELRIGNYIRQVKTHNGFDWDKIRTVAAINKECYLSVNVLEEGESGVTLSKLKLDRFEPIPLTEEWLVKFGFVRIKRPFNVDKMPEGTIDYYHNKHNYYYNKGSMFLDQGNDEGWNVDLKIEFVHQLQNLHFALTGEELTLKDAE